MNNSKQTSLNEKIKELFEITNELESLYPGRKFTIDGHTIGSIGEVLVAEKYNLPFILLSDPELSAIKDYGVWQEKKMCGKVGMGVVRTTFIIDENGNIEKIMDKVKPDTNAQEILEYLAK